MFLVHFNKLISTSRVVGLFKTGGNVGGGAVCTGKSLVQPSMAIWHALKELLQMEKGKYEQIGYKIKLIICDLF